MRTDQDDFLWRAAKCLRMAEQFHGQHREELRQIARAWMRLAEEAAAESGTVAGPTTSGATDGHEAEPTSPGALPSPNLEGTTPLP
jgi:hypothetical protein